MNQRETVILSSAVRHLKEDALFQSSQVSPACPSDKSSIKMKISVSIGGMMLTGGNCSSETNISAAFSALKLTWTALILNAELRADRPSLKLGFPTTVIQHVVSTSQRTRLSLLQRLAG